jgi:ABC-type multidrug transport system fused ATPase/permease subunit
LALARGLMAAQDSDILLLDESTSSVDSVNEKKIYQNIFSAFPEKTIIAAIHKLHLLPMFDMIYVFDKGTIMAS